MSWPLRSNLPPSLCKTSPNAGEGIPRISSFFASASKASLERRGRAARGRGDPPLSLKLQIAQIVLIGFSV